MSYERNERRVEDGIREGGKTSWAHSVHNPHNWSASRKWGIAFVACIVTFSAGINGTAILTAEEPIGEEFGFSSDAFPTIYWTVTAFSMGASLGPMIGMPLIEEFGVIKGYMVTYIGFMIFLVPQAVAQNFATLIVTRFFAGMFAATLQNSLEIVCADMFKTDLEQSLPINLFTFVFEGGYTLGPTYAACFPLNKWRWIFYAHLIASAVFLPVLFFGIEETRPAIIQASLRRKVSSGSDDETETETEASPAVDVLPKSTEQDAGKRGLFALFYESIVRPSQLLFTQPTIFVLTLWAGFSTALVFICAESVESVYTANYSFNSRQIGVMQVAIFVGEIVGFLACLPQNTYYLRSAHWNKEKPGTPSPEARLMLAIPGSFIGLAGGLFWYAWTARPYLHWILPAIGLGLVGFGIQIVVNCVILYMTDAYTDVAGSAVAAINLGETFFSAWIPLSTSKMYKTLGSNWGSSVLAFIALVLSCAPIVLTVYGPRIRARSVAKQGLSQ